MTRDPSEPVGVSPDSVDDDVDLLITTWSEILPEVDLTPLDVMSRLRRIARWLDVERAAAFAAAGLVIWEFDVLASLRRAGTEVTAGALATATGTSSAGVTHRIDRLVERGFVQRSFHPTDGRSVLVGLTDDGAEAVDKAMTELACREERMLSDFTPADRGALEKLLRRLSAR